MSAEEIARLRSFAEQRFSPNRLDRTSAIHCMSKLKFEHDIDTTEMVLEMANDPSPDVKRQVIGHFTQMLFYPGQTDVARGKIDEFLFEPELQDLTISALSRVAFPSNERTSQDEFIAQCATEKIIEMSYIFKTLSTDSKCVVGDTITTLGERDLLEEFFVLTRNSKYLKVLQRNAEVAYILDTEYEQDIDDPDYYHRKLLEIKPKTNKVILFLQLLSRLQHSEAEGRERNYPHAQKLFSMIYPNPTFFRDWQTQRRLSTIAFEKIAALYGVPEGDYKEEGIQSLIELGLQIPLGYFGHCLDPELTPTVSVRGRAITRLPRTLSHIEYYRQAANDPNRFIRIQIVRRLTEFPTDSHGPVNHILESMDVEEGTRIHTVIQEHLNKAQNDQL